MSFNSGQMYFSRADADVWSPGDMTTVTGPGEALAQVTHLCVAAHQDDIEIMAQAGIDDCLDQPGKAFGGVVVTDGSGSPRAGRYSEITDTRMRAIRRQEQREAAALGRYAVQIQLGHPSEAVKAPRHPGVAHDLARIFRSCRAEVVYLHNPADKHDTHVALFLRCIEALRALPSHLRPARVLGCEVWRDLDWMVDADKVLLDSGRHAELAGEILRIFDSQNSGGKRYDLAVPARRVAHATFHTSHAPDRVEGITWAMDLTPLMNDPAMSAATFARQRVQGLMDDIDHRIARFS